MSCGCGGIGGRKGFGEDWIWIIIAVIVILCLCGDNGFLGGILGDRGECCCD